MINALLKIISKSAVVVIPAVNPQLSVVMINMSFPVVLGMPEGMI